MISPFMVLPSRAGFKTPTQARKFTLCCYTTTAQNKFFNTGVKTGIVQYTLHLSTCL